MRGRIMAAHLRRQPHLRASTNPDASTQPQKQQQQQPQGEEQPQRDVECVATGMDVMCEINYDGGGNGAGPASSSHQPPQADEEGSFMARALSTALLISPFFFWGTSMVAMKVRAVWSVRRAVLHCCCACRRTRRGACLQRQGPPQPTAAQAQLAALPQRRA